MKLSFAPLLALSLLVACGSDETSTPGTSLIGCDGDDLYDTPALDWLVGTWVEGQASDRTDRLIFARGPRRFTQEISRQVGDEDTPDIPYPTSCRYRQVSETLCLNDVSRGDASTPSYRLAFRVSRIELIDHPENDAACGKYIEEKQSDIDRGNLQYHEELAQGAGGNLVVDRDQFFGREP